VLEIMKDPKDRLIVALDVPDERSCERVLSALKGTVGFIKIGLELFTGCGPRIVEKALEGGLKVFLDLKFHDIPNTAARAVQNVAGLGVSIINVHCLGGIEMMRAAREALEKTCAIQARPLLVGVTVLTSHSEETFSKDLAVAGSLADSVKRLALLAQRAGLDGVVASPKEIGLIKEACGKDFRVITPGVRPAWAGANDQKRVMTPKEAIQAGADLIVVGRPIVAAENPREAAKRILEEMEGKS